MLTYNTLAYINIGIVSVSMLIEVFVVVKLCEDFEWSKPKDSTPKLLDYNGTAENLTRTSILLTLAECWPPC